MAKRKSVIGSSSLFVGGEKTAGEQSGYYGLDNWVRWATGNFNFNTTLE